MTLIQIFLFTFCILGTEREAAKRRRIQQNKENFISSHFIPVNPQIAEALQ